MKVRSKPVPTPIPTPIPQYGKWITPAQSVCENSGGRYGEYENINVCQANWENAKTICSASGDALPTIETLSTIVTDCGGVINDYDNNLNNESYQACYREKGFTSDGYWSSTSGASDSSNAWIVHFDDGDVGRNSKTDEYSVRCVRGGQ